MPTERLRKPLPVRHCSTAEAPPEVVIVDRDAQTCSGGGGFICDQVLEWTDSETAADWAAFLLDKPFRILMIVLVAALNIVSGLIMLVKDKGQDIAILRTMGASQGSIMRIFLITGAAIGVVGTLSGFLLGMLICVNIESIRQFLSWMTNTELFSPELYFLSKLPAEIDFGETVAVVIMALTLSFLATLYPSWRAARLDPVDALRYE